MASMYDPINGFTPVWLDYESQSACDLKKCGSYVYAEDPSTKVLCAAIIINGHRIFWTLDHFDLPSMPSNIQYHWGIGFMQQLFTSPITVIAHNVDFERPMTTRCLKLPEPPGGWRDTMDQTLMRGLPGGADAAGQYLLGMGKDIEGYKLMMATCKPRKKKKARGKAKAATEAAGDSFEMPVVTTDIMRRYVGYNFRDTDIQFGISERFGIDIKPEWEQKVNEFHRTCNHRGVQLDINFAQTLKSFDDVFKNEARRSVEEATHGAIKGTDLTRNDYVRAYLKTQGLELDNMRADTIEQVLDADQEGEIELPLEIYAVLTNRLVVTRAALAKVETALRGSCSDGRIYALLRYWGARTGRWSGARLQIQNMKRPSEDFDIEAAITAVENNDIEKFAELCKGHRPYELLSSLVRGVLVPRPGCVFVVGDFAQVEARGLLWEAEDWLNLQEHVEYDLGRGPDIYCRFASFLYKKEITKKQFPMERQVGKIGELACLAEGTPVLTDSGWKRIETIGLTDRIWDGLDYVSHAGVVERGVKLCQDLGDIKLTDDHEVLTEDGWKTAASLRASTQSYQSACAVGTSSFLAHASASAAGSRNTTADATAAPRSSCGLRISTKERLLGATSALSELQQKLGCAATDTQPSSQTNVYAASGSTAIRPWSRAVRTQTILGTPTMVAEGSVSPTFGKILQNIFGTLSRFLAGIDQAVSLIASTTISAMSPATFGSSPSLGTCAIPESLAPSRISACFTPYRTSESGSAHGTGITRSSFGSSTPARAQNASSPSRNGVEVRTYDIKSCGPRNRFQAGSFLVHNCGYQGSVGAVNRFAYSGGIDLGAVGIDPKTLVDAWRAKHPLVTDMWRDSEDAFRRAIRIQGKEFYAARCAFTGYPDRTEIRLPSGRVLTYMNARLEQSRRSGWEDSTVIAYDSAVKGQVRHEEIYGGKIIENITQAICRDFLADAMLRVEETGDEIVMHVHDEMVAEIPEEYADDAVNSMRQIMCDPPSWGKGMPLAAKPEIMLRYGK